MEDSGAWCAVVHGVTKSRSCLRDETTTTQSRIWKSALTPCYMGYWEISQRAQSNLENCFLSNHRQKTSNWNLHCNACFLSSKFDSHIFHCILPIFARVSVKRQIFDGVYMSLNKQLQKGEQSLNISNSKHWGRKVFNV